MPDRDHLGSIGDQGLQIIENQISIIGTWDDQQFSALLFAQHLPGNDVGMVLHRTDQHLIAAIHSISTDGSSDQVDRFRGSAGKDHTVGIGCMDELCHLGSNRLIANRRSLAEGMDTPVHIGTVLLIEGLHRLQHLGRFLSRGSAVEIDQRIPMDLLLQTGESSPDLIQVREGGTGLVGLRSSIHS